ncbi:MAG: hypothetical protein RRY21_07370, partial [Oscillospiraceae bacterium]
MTQIYRETITMPGGLLLPENPLPMFRDAAHDKEIASDGTLSAAECAGLGKNTGMRVLPYCMQDRFTLADKMQSYETV